MPKITCTDEAMELLRRCAHLPFRQTGVKVAPNTWEIPFDEETIERLNEVRLAGESLSDTIIRVTSLHLSGNKAN